jgi:hypothetical protein
VICNITQASTLLGYRSRSVLQRLAKAGHLRDYERGIQGRALMLETTPPGLPSLQEAVRSLTVARVGSPLSRPVEKGWDAFTDECNSMLNPSLWGPPPWSADRWAGLAGVITGALERLSDPSASLAVVEGRGKERGL